MLRRRTAWVAMLVLCAGVAHGRPGPVHRNGRPDAPPSPPTVAVDAPLLGDAPALRRALRDLQRGRAAHARPVFVDHLAEASGGARAALTYLIARCDAALGWFAEAEAGFALTEAALPALGPRLRVDRALLARARGDDAEADRLVAALPPEAPDFVDLQIDLARRARAADAPADALRALDRVAPHTFWAWNTARVAMWRAEAHYAADGDARRFHAALVDIWRRHPRTRARDEARDALVAALADVKGPAPMPLPDVVEAAAEDARAGRAARGADWQRALKRRHPREAAELDALLTVERHPKRWSRRTVKEAAAALEKSRVPAIRDRLRLVHTRALRASGRYTPALNGYTEVATTATLPTVRAEAAFEGGRLARKMHRNPEARTLFQAYVDQPATATDQRGRALWELAWLDWLDGNLAAADARLVALIDAAPAELDTSKRSLYERALYWRARIALRQGRRDDAVAGWRFVMRRFPLSYYAVMARQWLARAGVDPGPLALGDARTTAPPRPYQLGRVPAVHATAVALYQVGLDREARAWIRRQFDLGRLGRDGTRLLSALYREQDDPWRSHWIVKAADPLDVDPGDPAHRDRWLAAFPTPFEGVVHAEAEEHGVDPLLLWAVMRQESAFRVRARSSARALGLMQVLYPTAKLVARKLLKEREPSLEYVLTKRGNVHYGAAYLRHLIDRFDGNLALAIAGYNAGPGAPESWLKRVGHLETDEFVEEIPYEEARGYTRKVLRSYAAYRTLYGPAVLKDPWKLPRLLPGAERPVAGTPSPVTDGI
jgi:soluble lytic murein transglycosylase